MGKPQSTVAERTQPLLERESELAAIAAAIERAEGGEGSLMLIEGAAGIGKTRLLAEATAIARERGFLVRSARGGELERGMPFGIARQLFEPVVERASEEERPRILTGSAELSLVALGKAEGEGAGQPGDPFAPIHGLYWLLANLADEKPVLLAIDDLHWADAQTLRYIDYLARRLADLPALVIANVRLGEPGPPPEIESLRLEAEAIHPDPLSPPAVAELISADLGGDVDAGFTEACAQATAGNPFLLAELIRALRADRIEPAAEAATTITALAPETVARQVLTRLGRFGEEAIMLARAIAVLGGSPQLRHTATLAGLDEKRARKLCDELREAEILAAGLPLDFVHPLVRRAIYRDLSEEERSITHRRAAEVLDETGSSAGDAAPHLVASVPNGDQWVVGKLGEAAWEAIRAGAYDAAVAYLRRALAEPPDDEFPLRFALGRALIQTDPHSAPRVLDDVANRATDEGIRDRALRDAAWAHFTASNWDAAIHRYARLIEALPEPEVEKRLVLEAQLTIVRQAFGRRDESGSARIRSAAQEWDETSVGGCLARQARALDLWMDGAPVDEVIRLASAFPPPPWNSRTMVSVAACLALADCGRWDLARAELIRIADSWRGMATSVAYTAHFRVQVERRSGNLFDAEAEARTGMEIAAVVSASNPGRNLTISLLGVLIDRGELDEADALAAGLDLSMGPQEAPMYPWPLEVRGYLSLALDQLEAGVSDLLKVGEGAERGGFLNPADTPWRQEAAPALASLGRTAEAEELIAVAEQRARTFGAAHVIGTVLRSRALIEPRKRQIETLRESVEALETYGPPHELARSLLELGASLRREGRRSEAREPLDRSLELAHRSGAGGIERRAREELAAIGSRPRSAYRSGVASLTASELRTAKLAAEGLGNREIAERLFVTRRTVETHLTHAYAKLEIKGREELAAALEDEGVQAP